MVLEQLENFLTLAEFMNFTKAADYLYISQSTLSRHITSLEESLDVPLFIRDNRSVRLTEAGRVLVREGHLLVRKIKEVKEKVQTADKGTTGRLSVASPNFYYQPLFEVYKALCATYPGIAFVMLHRPTGMIIDTIAREKADIGIAFSFEIEQDMFEFEVLCLYRECFCVVVPLDHPFSSRTSISLSALRGERILFLNRESYKFLERFDAYTHFKAHDPTGSLQSDSRESLLLRVKAGVGVAVVPRPYAVENAFGYAVLDIADFDSSFDVVMLSKKDSRNPSVALFRDIVCNCGLLHPCPWVCDWEVAAG